MPFNLDPVKIFVLLAVALIVLGPERLPVVARTLGSLIRDFQLFRQRMLNEVKEIIPDTQEIVSPITSAISQLPSPSKIIRNETSLEISNAGSNGNSTAVKPESPLVVVDEKHPVKKAQYLGEGTPIWLPEDPRLN